MDRTRIINEIIKEKGYKSYLEIGYGDGVNFKNIEVEKKVAVDPIINQTSDDFFANNLDSFDLIFIDGLHQSDQVERDIVNSWKSLAPKGTILIHDCMPWSEEVASRTRKTIAWTGDVYKCVVGLIKSYGEKIKMTFIEERAGIIKLEKRKTRLLIKPGFTEEIDYAEFDSYWKPVIKNMV